MVATQDGGVKPHTKLRVALSRDWGIVFSLIIFKKCIRAYTRVIDRKQSSDTWTNVKPLASVAVFVL